MSLTQDLGIIARQEEELVFPEFDLEVAWKLGSRLRELAVFRQLPVAIDVRKFGQPLFYTAMKGSTPDNADWVRRKGNVVARFHRSSYGVGLALKQTNSNLADEICASFGRLCLPWRLVSPKSCQGRGDRFRHRFGTSSAGGSRAGR